MCARRFLIVIFVLTLLAVAAGFAIFQFGGRVLIKGAIPTGRFEAAEAGSRPDYTLLGSWIAHPGLPDDPSRWQPQNEAAGGGRVGAARVFYVHPTTYLLRDRWNGPLQAGADSEFRTRLFVQSQASAFAAVGSVWAPRYRQAAFGAFLLDSEDAQAALDLAYGDVSAAFDHFLREAGDGPIVLAGHSQGALHLQRLLAEKIAGTPLQRRIAAAYVVGWPISTTADLPRLGLPACRAPAETGCILSWMTFRDPANPDLIFDQWETSVGLSGGDRRQRDVLCVNPLTGTQNGAAGPDEAGTLVPSGDLRSAELSSNLLAARCERGLLIVDGEIPPLGSYVLPGNNYHVYDYALFWGAVRADAQRRLAAWAR